MAADITNRMYGLESSPGGIEFESLFNQFKAAVATDDGKWQDARGWDQILLDITIAGTATIEIRASNALLSPADSAHGYSLATAVTSTGTSTIAKNIIPRWFKLYISVWSSGNVDVLTKMTGRVMNLMNT